MTRQKKSKSKELKDLYDEDGNWKGQKRLVIGAIRRLFRQSPQFKEIHEASRVEVPRYNKDGSLSKKPHVKKTCESCGNLFSSGNIAIDHVDPMVPLHLVDDDMDYNEIVDSIICKKDNLQRLCNPKKGKKNKPKFLEFCHQKKTHKENFFRKKWQEHFIKKGITAREDKDAEYHFFHKQLETEWEELYKIELEEKLKEIAEKEERKRIREEKKLAKIKKE
jgi:hypothetical protein